jgi:hypothetical protein
MSTECVVSCTIAAGIDSDGSDRNPSTASHCNPTSNRSCLQPIEIVEEEEEEEEEESNNVCNRVIYLQMM